MVDDDGIITIKLPAGTTRRSWTANQGECPNPKCQTSVLPAATVCPECGAELPHDDHVIDYAGRTHTVTTLEGMSCSVPLRHIPAGEPAYAADSQMMRDADAADVSAWERAVQDANRSRGGGAPKYLTAVQAEVNRLLVNNEKTTTAEIWALIPASLDDAEERQPRNAPKVYRDGAKVVQRDQRMGARRQTVIERSITYRTFSRYVTEALPGDTDGRRRRTGDADSDTTATRKPAGAESRAAIDR